MARVVVIGGSGHVGTYLVPALVGRGHEVVNVSRGQSAPYRSDPAWAAVEQVAADRTVEDASGTFGARIAALRPDIVVDMISFDLPSTQALVEALRGRVEHLLHCGTIWVYGRNAAVPATEDDPLDTFGDYGTHKAAIETWLLHEARRTGFPATVFRPGHIVGPGWVPINPVGNVDPDVFSRIARGRARAAQFRAGDPPSRPRRRRRAADHASHPSPVARRGRGIQRGLAPGAQPARLRRVRCSAGSGMRPSSASSPSTNGRRINPRKTRIRAGSTSSAVPATRSRRHVGCSATSPAIPAWRPSRRTSPP